MGNGALLRGFRVGNGVGHGSGQGLHYARLSPTYEMPRQMPSTPPRSRCASLNTSLTWFNILPHTRSRHLPSRHGCCALEGIGKLSDMQDYGLLRIRIQ